MHRNGTSQGERKKERTGHQPQPSGGWRRKCIWCVPRLCSLQRHFHACHWSLWQGNHLPCNWWDEGEGWLRWVLSTRCHAGCPGCRPQRQGAGHYCPLHKLQATGGNRTKTPGPGAQSALRALARSGMKIGQIEDVTPILSNSTHRKGAVVVAVCEQDSSNYCFLLINCFDVKKN